MSVADEEGDPILCHQQQNLFVYKSYNSCSKTSQERGVEIVVVNLYRDDGDESTSEVTSVEV